MLRALAEFRIGGLKTLIGFHRALLASAAVGARRDVPRPARGPRRGSKRARVRAGAAPAADAADDGAEPVEQTYAVEVSGRRFDVRVIGAAGRATATAPRGRRATQARARRAKTRKRKPHGSDTLASPMQGNVWKVPVSEGQQVAEGDVVTIIEAMKMENEITAHKSGVIAELPISEGDSVRSGDVLAVIKDAPDEQRARVGRASPTRPRPSPRCSSSSATTTAADWPSDNAFLASVERLLEDRDTEFLLASRDDDSAPAGVLQLRFRFSVWSAAPDAWLEDLFVRADARRAGVGDALLTLAIERATRARRQGASSSTRTRTTRRRSRSTSATASRRRRRAAAGATCSSAARWPDATARSSFAGAATPTHASTHDVDQGTLVALHEHARTRAGWRSPRSRPPPAAAVAHAAAPGPPAGRPVRDADGHELPRRRRDEPGRHRPRLLQRQGRARRVLRMRRRPPQAARGAARADPRCPYEARRRDDVVVRPLDTALRRGRDPARRPDRVRLLQRAHAVVREPLRARRAAPA